MFFKVAEMHCKGGLFDKCTLRAEISVNPRKAINFSPKRLIFCPKRAKVNGSEGKKKTIYVKWNFFQFTLL